MGYTYRNRKTRQVVTREEPDARLERHPRWQRLDAPTEEEPAGQGGESGSEGEGASSPEPSPPELEPPDRNFGSRDDWAEYLGDLGVAYEEDAGRDGLVALYDAWLAEQGSEPEKEG